MLPWRTTSIVTVLIRSSLASGAVSQSIKKVIVTAMLKMSELDCDELINYRSASNLRFLREASSTFRKVLEKVVAAQIIE